MLQLYIQIQPLRAECTPRDKKKKREVLQLKLNASLLWWRSYLNI